MRHRLDNRGPKPADGIENIVARAKKKAVKRFIDREGFRALVDSCPSCGYREYLEGLLAGR